MMAYTGFKASEKGAIIKRRTSNDNSINVRMPDTRSNGEVSARKKNRVFSANEQLLRDAIKWKRVEERKKKNKKKGKKKIEK